MNTLVVTITDLAFTIKANVQEHNVDFIIYDVVHWTESEVNSEIFNVPHYEIPNKNNECTTEITEAAVYAHGNVKWDGCSNWYFDEQNNCMLHFCGKQDLDRLGNILLHCFDWTKELLGDKWLE